MLTDHHPRYLLSVAYRAKYSWTSTHMSFLAYDTSQNAAVDTGRPDNQHKHQQSLKLPVYNLHAFLPHNLPPSSQHPVVLPPLPALNIYAHTSTLVVRTRDIVCFAYLFSSKRSHCCLLRTAKCPSYEVGTSPTTLILVRYLLREVGTYFQMSQNGSSV